MTVSLFPEEAGLETRAQHLAARLQGIRDPQARLGWLVEQARQRPLLPEALRLDAHRVEGCQVRLWFVPEQRGELCFFRTDSDAVSLKALVGLTCDFYSGQTPGAILAQPFTLLEDYGLLRQVAESRRATILRVADKIQAFARSRATPPPA